MKLNCFCLSVAFGLGLGASVAPLYAAECLSGPPTSKALANSTVATKAGFTPDGEHGGLLNFDRFRAERRASGKLAAVPTAGFEGRHQSALFDRPLGVPTFLWARTDAKPVAVGALTSRELLVARAREQLRAEASLLKLSEDMIASAKVTDAQYNGNGPAVVRFKQQINGIEVFGRNLNVLLDKRGTPVAVSGYFATDLNNIATPPAFVRSAPQAIAAAARSLFGNTLDLNLAQIRPFAAAVQGAFQWFKAPALLGSNQLWNRMPRAKAIYYPRDGRVEPAYYVEILTDDGRTHQQNAYGLVVSGLDGGILHRRNLVSSAVPFNYTVFADGEGNNFHPFDSPLGNGYTPFPGSSSTDRLARVSSVTTAPTVSLIASSGVTDPWLADDATTTVGNNTDACIDAVNSPTSGLPLQLVAIEALLNVCQSEVGDIYPETTSANTFDYPLTPDEDPSGDTAKRAAAVNLFYINNWLHDWWYVHGFNEEAGNAQMSNYERGGEEGDPLLAQGQDSSGRSNANMSTPADGSSPRMQQYLFDGVINGYVKKVAPTPDAESLVFSVGSFSPASFDVPATEVVIADDGVDVATDGCGPAIPDPTGLGVIPGIPAPPQASLAGAIALIDRGSCSFTTKARFGQISGAAAVVIVNNSDGDPIPMGNADLPISLPIPTLPIPVPTSTDFTYTTPTVMITRAEGQVIKDLIAAGQTVTMQLHREASTDLDGTVDNQIVAHEFFHYVHHRLTDSSNQQSSAMSEGWGESTPSCSRPARMTAWCPATTSTRAPTAWPAMS